MIIENILPGIGIVGLILVIFNPNAIGAAHLIQSDILYMFMVTITLYCLFLYKSKGSVRLSILIGFLFGLTCLVRTSGQYLILLLPIIYIVIGLLQKSKQPLIYHLYNGVISIIIAIVVIFPWMQHNANAGWGYNLTTPEIQVVYFRDNVIYLESIENNISLGDSSKKVKEDEEKYISSYAEKWLYMSKHDKLSSIASYYKKQLFTYNYNTVVKGLADSWIGLFGAGGAANLHNLLVLDGSRSIQVMSNSEKHMSRTDAVFDTLLKSNLIVISISLLSFIYVIVLRILGLMGLVKMIKCREYGVLFILSGIIIYFMLIALFVGNSRYRLPIEPALIIMAVYGFSAFIKKR
jgi:4-amino-4-deoxy-L-arabinose transferase-like glycosyltransferase